MFADKAKYVDGSQGFFVGSMPVTFKEVRNALSLRLILWGLERFLNPNVAGKMTANVLKLGADEDEVKLVEAVGKAFEFVGQCDKQDEKFVAWRYTENGVRWKLFFTDWLLWVDSKQKGQGFSYLAQALAHPQHADLIAALNVEKSNEDPLENFRQQFSDASVNFHFDATRSFHLKIGKIK